MSQHADDRADPSVLQIQARGKAAARQWLADLCHSRRLSPTQRRVAQSYLDTMPAAAFLSTSEAAHRAGVSQATITRFAATLGFGAYADFRNALRQVLLGATSDEKEAAAPPQGTDPIAEAQNNLDGLRNTLESSAMSSAVAEMAEARTLAIVGFRASAPLAAWTGFFASRILDDVRVLTDPSVAMDGLSQLRFGTSPSRVATLFFAMPRYPAATVRALRFGRSLGVPTVLVVDSPLADFASDADHVLVAPVGTGLVFDSYAAPVVLATALVDGLAGARPRRAQERLEAHEALVHTWVHQPSSDPE